MPAMKIAADQNIPFVKECFESIGEVTLYAGRQITADALADAEILLVRSVTRVDAQLLEKSAVKFVATATIGTDHVDEPYLASRGIGFASAPGSNANSVSEYITAALLVLGQKYNIRLAGSSIGIVGVGNVGSRVAKKAEALGMKVFLNDPPLARKTDDAKYRPIEELYDCDFVTFHTPLTKTGQDKTLHLAGEEFFSRLKKGAVFFNSSRGGVHDTATLKNAIKSGKLKACLLDVWENEPEIDAELLAKVNIATPHIAGYSYDGKVAGMIMIYEAACRHFGLKVKHRIEDFLPPALVPSIDSGHVPAGYEQEALADVVRRIYDIEADDQRTRRILELPAEERGKYFDKLRKEYPVRREFQNTVITSVNNPLLAKQLAGLGFKVKHGGK
jgi:erythronate-4-phosphate dehydrogenase